MVMLSLVQHKSNKHISLDQITIDSFLESSVSSFGFLALLLVAFFLLVLLITHRRASSSPSSLDDAVDGAVPAMVICFRFISVSIVINSNWMYIRRYSFDGWILLDE